jgi:peptide/nickel transport system substrate-binding protein
MIGRRALLGRAAAAAALLALDSGRAGAQKPRRGGEPTPKRPEPDPANAQTPKRGGTLALRLWDPPHWDPYLTLAFRTQVPYSFTHSRLLRHKAGPAVSPGTLEVEGDLAESWSQPDEVTYVFKLRRGVRFQPKPPVNGRELTAADVVYSMERFRTIKGNPQASMLAMVDGVSAPDRSTVKFTLKEPYAWFLDMLANPMTLPIVARECVDKFGDLKRPEATVGTGPWMLERYRPNVGFTLARHPQYFRAGMPYVNQVEATIDEDNASRLSAFLAGKYDLGWENGGAINRTDWNAMQAKVKRFRPDLRTAEHQSNVVYRVFMRTDKPPFSDVRVRRAVSLAVNRKAIIEGVADGAGWLNAAVPLALGDWGLAIEHLGDGEQYYKHDPAEARRLLAEAGHPNGFATVMDFNNYGSSFMDDAIALILRDLKTVGIDARLNRKEYGAYIATTATGNYEGMYYGATPALDPDSYLYTNFAPGHPRNVAKVNDAALTDLLVRQRRTADRTARRALIHDIQRHVASQQYIVEVYSPVTIYVWDGVLKNYGPNLGYDYGGRLVAAWLNR